MTIDPTLANVGAEQQHQQQQGTDLGAIADVASVGLDIAGAATRGLAGASAAPEAAGAAAAVVETGTAVAEAGTGILGVIGGFFEGLASL